MEFKILDEDLIFEIAGTSSLYKFMELAGVSDVYNNSLIDLKKEIEKVDKIRKLYVSFLNSVLPKDFFKVCWIAEPTDLIEVYVHISAFDRHFLDVFLTFTRKMNAEFGWSRVLLRLDTGVILPTKQNKLTGYEVIDNIYYFITPRAELGKMTGFYIGSMFIDSAFPIILVSKYLETLLPFLLSESNDSGLRNADFFAALHLNLVKSKALVVMKEFSYAGPV